jgi:hypothetical protein
MARMSIEKGNDQDAIRLAMEAERIGAESGDPEIASYGNWSLALARLCIGDLTGARDTAEATRQYDVPRNNHNVLALLGLIALRQVDRAAAEAFQTAISHADVMLERCRQNYDALDAKGLALAGLAVLEGGQRPAEAIATFQAARAITTAPGVIGRVRGLLDLLAPADAAGVLAGVRAAADGENDAEPK